MRRCGKAFGITYAGKAPMARTASSVSTHCGVKKAMTPRNGCRKATGWPGVCAWPWIRVARRTMTRPLLAGVFREYAAVGHGIPVPNVLPAGRSPRLGVGSHRTIQRGAAAILGPRGMIQPALRTTTAPILSRTSTCARSLRPASRSPTCCLRTCWRSSSASVLTRRPRRCAASLNNVACPCARRRYPLALSLIRTVNRLGPSELILTERCRDEFIRLSQSDRAWLSLFSCG